VKILYVSSRYPFPPTGGHKIRVYNFIKHLSQNHNVTLLCIISSIDKGELKIPLTSEQQDLKNRIDTIIIRNTLFRTILGILSSIFPRSKPLQLNLFNSKRIIALIADFSNNKKFDLSIFHLARMGQFSHLINSRIRILDIVDSLVVAYREAFNYSKSFSSILKMFEISKLNKWDLNYINTHFDQSIVASERDLAHYKHIGLGDKISVVTNGVDLEYFSYRAKSTKTENRIVFVGSFLHKANLDGILFFISNILPLIKTKIPDIILLIVGISPPKRLIKLQDDYIRVYGSVPDVRPYLYESAISICPIRFGAGIQNKILESLALGTPVVSSQVGVAGLRTFTESELIFADINNEKEYSSKIVTILKNRTLLEKYSLGGREYVENNYNWNSIINDFVCRL